MSKANLFLYSVPANEDNLEFFLDIWDEYLTDKELFDYIFQLVRWYYTYRPACTRGFVEIVNEMELPPRLNRFCNYAFCNLLLAYPKSLKRR